MSGNSETDSPCAVHTLAELLPPEELLLCKRTRIRTSRTYNRSSRSSFPNRRDKDQGFLPIVHRAASMPATAHGGALAPSIPRSSGRHRYRIYDGSIDDDLLVCQTWTGASVKALASSYAARLAEVVGNTGRRRSSSRGLSVPNVEGSVVKIINSSSFSYRRASEQGWAALKSVAVPIVKMTLESKDSEVMDAETLQPRRGDIAADSSSSSSDSSMSDSDTSDTEYFPASISGRRFGVSAEATGVVNVRFEKWDRPISLTMPEYKKRLALSLMRLPLLSNVQGSGFLNIADAMSVENFSKGEAIFRRGDDGSCGYFVVSGKVGIYTDEPIASQCIREAEASDFFGDHSMLWGFRREHSAFALTSGTVLGKLPHDVFTNLVTRHEMEKATKMQTMVRSTRLFETLNDEMVAKVTDVLSRQVFNAGELIIKKGTKGAKMYFLWQGECVALSGDGNEVRRYRSGEHFGELSLMYEWRWGVTLVACTKVKVLVLGVGKFERLFGSLSDLYRESLVRDPRTRMAEFYKGSHMGEQDGTSQGNAFGVYRPTSRNAIAKMIEGDAVGKALNIKGKSAKKNVLSGYVPYLQISENEHKAKIEDSPADARVTIFYQSQRSRRMAYEVLAPLLDPSYGLNIDEPRAIYDVDRYASSTYGLDVPEAVVREAYIMRPDISFRIGWDTGRPSEPSFMDMNMHSARVQPSAGTASHDQPSVVLYQFDKTDPMNPHGLLLAYAEASVKPVVSDFDLLTIGSNGTQFSPLPPEQLQLVTRMLSSMREVFRTPEPGRSWNSRWLEVHRRWHEQGSYPNIPRFGFGDEMSSRLIETVVEMTKTSGAVRHGAECFNFLFPQELDSEYLIIWDGLDAGPWMYADFDGMIDFLLERHAEGYKFPMNPIWALFDEKWYRVFTESMECDDDGRSTFEIWYPPGSNVQEMVEAIHAEFPDGFDFKSGERKA